jgi:DNA (cytosine-5)-methyltransferase 1
MPASIRVARQTKRLSQAALAESARVPLVDLKKWERGLERVPKTAATRIAAALGINSNALITTQRTPEIGEGYVTYRSDGQIVMPARLGPPKGRIRVLDLFCGTGGFSYGFERTGKFAVTGGIDLLPDRVRSFHANHPSATAIAADIRQFPTKVLGDHSKNPQIIIGGPPCQGFSSIRPFRTLTEADSRNSLPEYFLLALRELTPKCFVFENVVGLLTHGEGKFFFALLDAFRHIGYSVDWRVLNAASFGLPQYRERVVVVGTLAKRDFCWPNPTHDIKYRSMAGRRARLLLPQPLFTGTLEQPVSTMDAIGDLPKIDAGESAVQYAEGNPMTPFQKRARSGESVLTLHEATAHSERMLRIIRLAGRNRSALPKGMTTSGFSSCYSRLDADEPSTTLTVNFVHPSSNRCIHPHQDRALTPREGARIQGFPDNFQFAGSRPQIVKQIGNAVPPILGEALANAVAEYL